MVASRRKGSDINKLEKLFSYYVSNAAELATKVKWVDLDLTDIFSIETALEGVHTVYHCAGFVSFNRNQRRQLMEVNHEGTRRLVDMCLHKKIKAFCHVSSLATLHNLEHTGLLNEQVFWKKSGRESNYAISKYNAEREVWRAMEEGLNAVIVNPGVVLSPGFWDQSSATIFKTCYKGNLFYAPGTTAYVHAADVAHCMVSLTEKGCFGERFLLLENNYSFRQIFGLIQTAFHKKPPVIRAGRLMLNAGWLAESVMAFLTGRSAVITRSIINSALNTQLYSNQKIKTTLGFEFRSTANAIGEICVVYENEQRNR